MSGDLQQRADRLRARAHEPFPPAWQPAAEGDEIVGVFRRLEFGHAKHRGRVGIAIFEEAISGREFAVWLMHEALKQEMRRAKPSVGDLVHIERLGEKLPAGGGNPYVNYRVTIDKPRVTAADWDHLDEPGDTEPAEGEHAAAAPDVCHECGAYLEQEPHQVWCSRA
ncbi:MAG TPA: hypothetical protein VF731_00725 [Solirubrobacterales bacterium]